MWQKFKLILLLGLFRKESAFLWMERHQRVHHPLEMGVCHRCTRHCRLMGPPGTFFLFTFCNNSTQRRALSTSGALLALIVGFTLSLAHYSFFLRFFVCKIGSLMTIRLSPACLPSSSAPAGRPSTSRIWRRSLSPTSRKGASAIGFRWVLVSWFCIHDSVQVLCNGAMATELALLYLLDVGSSDLPVDFRHQ